MYRCTCLLLLNLFAGVNTPLIIGLTVLGLIVTIIVIIVAILFVYFKSFRRGYSRLSGERSRQALDTLSHNSVSRKNVNHKRSGLELSSEVADVTKDGRPIRGKTAAYGLTIF